MKYHPMGNGAVTAPAPKAPLAVRVKAFATRVWRCIRVTPLILFAVAYFAVKDAGEMGAEVAAHYREVWQET